MASRMWNAFGFAAGPDGSHGFSAADEAVLNTVTGPDSSIDPTALIAAARTIGQSMSRLAEWEAEQVPVLADKSGLGLSTDEIVDTIAALHDRVWRRHVAMQLDRADGDDTSSTVIVGFADIVGYTALSRRLRLIELEELLESFESQAHEIIIRHGGTVVKSLGDAVMFTAPNPSEAAAIALELQDLTSDGALPTLRIGLAEGEVLMRMGDLFGEPVNIAARLASSAREGTTLVDQTLADALSDDQGVRVRHIPTLSVRGYRRLKASALSRPHHDKKRSSKAAPGTGNDD